MHYMFIDREKWFAWYPIYIAGYGWTWFRRVYRSGHMINGWFESKWYEPIGKSVVEL